MEWLLANPIGPGEQARAEQSATPVPEVSHEQALPETDPFPGHYDQALPNTEVPFHYEQLVLPITAENGSMLVSLIEGIAPQEAKVAKAAAQLQEVRVLLYKAVHNVHSMAHTAFLHLAYKQAGQYPGLCSSVTCILLLTLVA